MCVRCLCGLKRGKESTRQRERVSRKGGVFERNSRHNVEVFVSQINACGWKQNIYLLPVSLHLTLSTHTNNSISLAAILYVN